MKIYINHFNRNRSSALRAMTLFCVGCFVENGDLEHEVAVLDGTGFGDAELEAMLVEKGIRYLPAPGAESFAATYNRGIADGTGSALIIAANDIFVPTKWDTNLLNSLPDGFEGMLIPYLSSSAYGTQEIRSAKLRKPIDPILCTLNLNFLTPRVSREVGLLDEAYSGSYNDIDYMLRIRSKKLRVIMRDIGPVKHLGKMTVSKATSWVPTKDKDLFMLRHPNLALAGWWLNPSAPEICSSRILRIVLKLVLCLPGRFKYRLIPRVVMLEVFFGR
jgi:hypothetical protein